MDKLGEFSKFYLGTAQVRLRNIYYCASGTDTDDCTGCSISDLEHNLPALISHSEYQQSLRESNITEHKMYRVGQPPRLQLPTSLELRCPHGRYRIQSAKRDDSCSSEDWWSVDLYASEISRPILDQLREHYRKHVPLSDGEKYLNIRYYEREKDTAEAMKWRKLVGTQLRNMNQILRNGWLCEVLDELEPFSALWNSFQISSFPHILGWRCSHEVEHYLVRMQKMWHTITDGNEFWCDRNTVQKLEGLAPQWSLRDRSMIEALINTDQIFSRVKDRTTRNKILERVLAVDGFILTFRTFFKDVKLLGPVMLRLRPLFPISEFFPPRGLCGISQIRPPSVREVLQKYYNGPNTHGGVCLVQFSEHDERFVATYDPAVCAYWQLCLFLMRQEHGNLSPTKKGENKREALDSPEWVVNLGRLSRKLGFESDNILRLCLIDPSLAQIRMHMHKERPSSYYTVASQEFDAEARSRQKGQEIFKRRPPLPPPLMTTDTDTSKVVPRMHQRLFLPNIWSALAQEARYALTDFGKLLLVLTSFFGDFGYGSALDIFGKEWLAQGHIEQDAVGDTPTSPSVYSLPDAHQDQESSLRSSAVYSVPTYPVASQEALLTSSGKTMKFWHLPANRHTRPVLEYTCDATRDDIGKIVHRILTQGATPSFTMVARDGRLKLCPPSDIHQRRKQSKTPEDIYFTYGKDAIRMWVKKELPDPDMLRIDRA